MSTNFPIEILNGKRYAVVPEHTDGICLWGPYETLPAGEYDVTFEIAPLRSASRDELCCRIDVAADVGRNILVEQGVSVGELAGGAGKITVPFRLAKPSRVEYRVFAIGPGFRARYFRRARPAGQPAPEPRPVEETEAYTAYSEQIVALENAGFRVSSEDGALVASGYGVTADIRGAEDFQLLTEIFLIQEYNLLPSRPCVAVDIGMNAGLASLALARDPKIRRIYGYEPFAAPYARAKRNFERNPALAEKIEAFNFGLADRDGTLTVGVSATSTIGTSIRGVTGGAKESIRIRDAAAELQPRIESARQSGLGVILKVDCEGSEFAIVESLERAALLPQIDVVMIEWHKWWSADKTQADLIEPMRRAGFFVFDRTDPRNPFAGMILAVRSAAGYAPDA